jgi:UDP-N-acetylglucosamine acyltransferase
MKHLFEKLKVQCPHPNVDKIEHIQPGDCIVTLKNITLSDTDYMSNHPISNELIIAVHVESCILFLINDNYLEDYTHRLRQISSFNAHEPVVSGDQLRVETELKNRKNNDIIFESRSYVNGKLCSEISLIITQTNPTSSSTFIHPTASVHSSVILGQGVYVGPYCMVNEGVVIGDHTVLKAHVMIDKWCILGANNTVEYGAVIGSEPQDAKYKGEVSWVQIGDNNKIREYVTINRATGGDQVTRVGSNTMILTNSHIGHNCTIGNFVVMANMVHLGGHVTIGSHATIGGLTGIHQFVRVGGYTMVGGYSRLIQDVPPFMLCDGNPAYVRNLNIVGCKRNGLTREKIAELKTLYKLLYRSNLNTKQAIENYTPVKQCAEADELLVFVKADASRGISKKTVAEVTEE